MKRQLDGPCDVVSKSMSFPQGSIPPKTQSRYMPFWFPQILHYFPAKYYKYLPRFDGELEGLIAEKYLQDFEYFLDLFEIYHDDVCMRYFSQFLQGNVKKWFKHFHPESINTWEALFTCLHSIAYLLFLLCLDFNFFLVLHPGPTQLQSYPTNSCLEDVEVVGWWELQ